MNVTCPVCSTEFRCKPYRLKRYTDGQTAQPPTCSYKCAHELLKQRGWKALLGKPEALKDEARARYERTEETVEAIAQRLGVSRSSVQNWAREQGWRRFKRTTSNRTQYRNAAAALLGRKLLPYEAVHHIDGDVTNNTTENLRVYARAKEHNATHGSIERCAFELLRQGVIHFDYNSGSYFIP